LVADDRGMEETTRSTGRIEPKGIENRRPAVNIRHLRNSLLAVAATTAALAPAAPAIAASSGPQRPVGRTLSAAAPAPDQSLWVTTPKFDIKDSDPAWVAKIWCSRDTPAGLSVLYPYTVSEGGYMWAWRNDSTPGVKVTSDSTATDDMTNNGLAFWVSNPNTKGDYAWSISIECQSTDPDANGSVATPIADSVGPTSATIKTTLTSTEKVAAAFKWYVQYGTSWAQYTSQSVATGNLNPGDAPASFNLTNLKPGTTYHYRVALVNESNGFAGETSYSGADQTFTTPAS
jgi:hypothetical protein